MIPVGEHLPNGWQWKKVGQVCDFLDSQRIPLNNEDRENRIRGKSLADLYPYYGANGQVGWIDDFLFNEPLILLAEDGGHFGSTEKPIAYSIYGKTWVNNHAHVLRPRIEIADFSYCLYALMIRPDVEQLISGTTRGKLNQAAAAQIAIPLPPLDEQKRIAAILEEADYARRTRRFTQSVSDSFLQEVFVEMFGDPVTNPMGWRRAGISELGEVETGNTPSRENSDYYGDYIEWIKTTNILKDSMYLTSAEEMLSAEGLEVGRFVDSGATMVTCIAGSVSSIGDVAYVDRKVAFNQQINAITPFEDVNPLFLYGLMRFSKPIIQDKATQGMKRIITKSKFEKVQLFKPPYDLQCKFAEILQDHSRSKLQQQESARQAEHLFQTLLHRAFRGEV